MSIQRWLLVSTLGLTSLLPCSALQSGSESDGTCTRSGVPRMVRFAGTLRDTSGAARTGPISVRFALYETQIGGGPRWQEVRTVEPNASGRYEVVLGCGAGADLPADLFATNEARWLGVQVLADAEPEQARVILVSVPYALKAQDAETLGGLPASAYVRAEALGSLMPTSGGKHNRQAAALESEGNVTTSTSVTTNAIPKFSGTDVLADSMLLELYNQAATDAFGNILPNEDVVRLGDGSGNPKRLQIAGRMVATGFDVTSDLFSSVHVVNTNAGGVGFQINVLSQTNDFTNGVFASAQSNNAIAIEGIVFEPTNPSVGGVDYSYALFGANRMQQGSAVYGVSLYDGASGATFPLPSGPVGIYASTAHSSGIPAVFDQRAGSGQILSARSNGSQVASLNVFGDFTTSGDISAGSFIGNGSGLSGVSATQLNGVDASNFARLDVATNQTLAGSLTLPVLALPHNGVLNLDGSSFLHGTGGANTFVGRDAGNSTNVSDGNTGIGTQALLSLTDGFYNTATGHYALRLHTSGYRNTATGASALYSNTTDNDNTATGYSALAANSGGTHNTADGSEALTNNTTGDQNTAVGTYALRSNTSGSGNTTVGYQAGYTATPANANTTGSSNTFVGHNSGPGTSTQLTNATAIGANATVSASNSLVLGNAANVGIGTQTPTEKLHVVGNILTSGSVTAASFSGSGAGLTGVTSTGLSCTSCVSTTELDFDPTTQSELDTHKTSGDHDARYARLATSNSFSSTLTAAGVIESTSGGFKFPDGSTQTTAISVAAVVNPLRVALLRWYEANTVGINVTVGTTPIGIAFDGENMWVANLTSNNVTKIRASDGVVQGTFAVAGGPYGVAYDGSSVWVTKRSGNSISKVRPSDGVVLGTFAVGTGPQGVAFDGANLWVANRDSNNVTKIRAFDGANLGTFAVGASPQSVAFDGTYVWVVNEIDGNVMKLNTSGAVLGTFATGSLSFGVAYDGANVWVTSTGTATVKKLRASDGALLGSFALGASPNGIAFDGSSVWVALQTGFVKKLRASDGTDLGSYVIAGAGRDVAFDGANVWITNQGVGQVSKR